MAGARYIYRGREIYVKRYQSVNATACAVFFRDKKGHEVRFTLNDELGVYDAEDKAQEALDKFAKKRALYEAISPKIDGQAKSEAVNMTQHVKRSGATNTASYFKEEAQK